MAQRNAFAKLRNATGRTIVAAILCHKYSDAPAQTQKFQKIADNTTTNGGLLVSYNTGTFTLGQDWWFVTWMDDLQRVFVTNPQNGRSFFDTVEKNMAGGLALATTYSGIDAVTTGTAVGAAAGPPGAAAGAAATVALAF